MHQPPPNEAEDRYVSPLTTRNASAEMQAVWSPRRKFGLWRRCWLALAQTQRSLGLDISDAQVDAIRDQLDTVDLEAAAVYERELRHDVMAHVHHLGDQAPAARPILHLGATSQYVVCNSELLQIREALQIIARKTALAIDRLAGFAADQRSLPTLAFTHYQPAQPTTLGKRAALWAYDLSLALEGIEQRLDGLRLRGVKGTTGTQASFLALFQGLGQDDAAAADSVERLDRGVCERLGWDPDRRFVITGQTYPRLLDAQLAGALSAVAAAAQKCATDLRLLANRKEVEEPFGRKQIGSSAMAYKRNPMRSERICGLARFVIGMTQTPYTTAAEQWFERTLDDSSCRRLTLPEPFLALDGVLDLLAGVADGLVVYPETIRRNLASELPFMATENLLMAAVQAGGDRQALHEVIREHSQAAAARVKQEAADNDLLDRLAGEPAFASLGLDLAALLEPGQYVGLAPQQVDGFIRDVVRPIRDRYDLADTAVEQPRV